jgi:cell division protein FtsQ
VSVRRAWPATIDVKVTERTAVASEPAAQGGYALLDATGRVLGVVPAPPSGMLVVSGVAPAGTPGSTAPSDTTPALQVAAALPASLRPHLTGIDVASGEVRLLLGFGGAITLGPPDQLPAKLLAVLTVIEQVDLTDLCTIDVRVPAAPSLTRGSPCL